MAVMVGMVVTGGVSAAIGVSRLKKTKKIVLRDIEEHFSRDPKGRMLGERVEEVRGVALEIVGDLQKMREEQQRWIEGLKAKAKENAPVVLLGFVVLRALRKRNGNRKER